MGAAVAAALRAGREPAPHRGAREPRARDAPDRQRRRRPRAGRRATAKTAAHRSPTMRRMRATRPSPRSCSTGCATARRMPARRWSGWRASWRSPAPTPRQIILGEHQTLSSGNVTTGNIVRGLRLINDVDWTVWFEEVSRVDALLRERARLCRARFPFARPVPRARSRNWRAAPNLIRIRGRRAGDRAGRIAEDAADGDGPTTLGGRCRLLPGRRAPCGAGSRRSATGPAFGTPLQARLPRAPAGWASSCRSSPLTAAPAGR